MLQDILNFIKENYSWLLTLFGSIVGCIFVVIFRRKSFIIQDYEIVSEIKYFINLAESKFGAGHGPEKLKYVLDLFSSKHGSWSYQILGIVEDMLSTPQKKERR